MSREVAEAERVGSDVEEPAVTRKVHIKDPEAIPLGRRRSTLP